MALLQKVVVAVGLLVATQAAADTIELRADPWCPYNCVPGSDQPGVLVELASEALGPYGLTVNYDTLNWARSLEQASRGRIDGVIGAVPEEATRLVFGPPLAPYVDAVAWRRGEGRALSSVADLDGLTVAAINGYAYDETIQSFIDAHRDDRTRVQFASGNDALLRNLRKLEAGRVDLVPETRAVLDYVIASNGMQDEFEIINVTEPRWVYIAFSPRRRTSDAYATALTEGMARLRASGRYEEILAAYALSGPDG